MAVTIYHNPRCSKSRQTLERIEAAGITPTIVKYLDTPLGEADLRQIAKDLGVASPRDMMRTKEAEYKEQNLKDADENQLFSAMAATPKLMERPIVVSDKGTVMGRPPENVDAIL